MKNLRVCAFVCFGRWVSTTLASALSIASGSPRRADDRRHDQRQKPSANYNILNGPGGNGTPGQGSYSRRLQPGDIVIIPPGVLHVWTEIPDQVTYLSVRPDPDRVLPGGYVNPLLLKNQLPQVK